MLEFPQKITVSEVLALYKGRSPEMEVQPEIEKLDFDKARVKENLMATSAGSVGIVGSATKNSQGIVIDRPDVWKKRIPISVHIIDENVPLSLFTMKTFVRESLGEEAETISFDLVKGKVEETDMDALYKGWRASFTEKRHIVHLEFVDRGDLFELVDRETEPKFRNQGFGNMMLLSSESFVQRVANDKQKKQIVLADTAQVDVICWLYNNGYRPQTEEDAKRLGEVLAGDESIVLGDRKYIFKNVPEDERVIKLENGRTIPNRHNAYRIKLVKEIEPETPASIVDIQEQTRRKLIKN